MRYVLIGDGDSPHLLKWARALAAIDGLELWAASSRGFAPGFDAVLPETRRLALHTAPDAAGGNVAALRHLPTLARWLKAVRADWLNPHYLSSHGTLVWLAQRLYGVPGRVVASAWGSDILVTPQRSMPMRWTTGRVLRRAALCTSDSRVMAQRMRELGAGEVMVFPFGLDAMPPPPRAKAPWLFFANRGLEPIYAPERVLKAFAEVAARQPDALLVVANDGSLRGALEAQVESQGLADRVRFVGRLDAQAQARWYAQATWYLSLPRSDSVSVSVLEAMAHGCVPLLSDLPANRELVKSFDNGLLLPEGVPLTLTSLESLAERAEHIRHHNRDWVQQHALFGPCVQAFVQRLRAFPPA
jgi:glycosyltransferase involved in cell wall biosynthesis